MSDNTIELLGQKFAYPTTWQGFLTVAVVFGCTTFLVYSLDKDQIDSWSGLINQTTEKAYSEALSTIENQRLEIAALTDKVNDLTAKAELSATEKEELYSDLESNRAKTEKAIMSLSNLQEQRKIDWYKTYDKWQLPDELEKKQRVIFTQQEEQIQQQLESVEARKGITTNR